MEILDPRIEQFFYERKSRWSRLVVLKPHAVNSVASGKYPVAKRVKDRLQELFVPSSERGNPDSVMPYGDYRVDAYGGIMLTPKAWDHQGNVTEWYSGWRQKPPGVYGRRWKQYRPPISSDKLWLKMMAGSLGLGPRHLPRQPDPDLQSLDCILFDIDPRDGLLEGMSSLDYPPHIRERYLRPVLDAISEVFADLRVPCEPAVWSTGGAGWWVGIWFQGLVKLGLVQTLHSLIVEKARGNVAYPIKIRPCSSPYSHVQQVECDKTEPHLLLDQGNTGPWVCRSPGGVHNATGRRGRFLCLNYLSNVDGFVDPLLSIQRSVPANAITAALSAIHQDLRQVEERLNTTPRMNRKVENSIYRECVSTETTAKSGSAAAEPDGSSVADAAPATDDLIELDISSCRFAALEDGRDEDRTLREQGYDSSSLSPSSSSSISTTLLECPGVQEELDGMPTFLDGKTNSVLIMGGSLSRLVSRLVAQHGTRGLKAGDGVMAELRDLMLNSKYRSHADGKRHERKAQIDYNIRNCLDRLVAGEPLGHEECREDRSAIREMAEDYARQIKEADPSRGLRNIEVEHIERFLLKVMELWRQYGTVKYTHDEWALACGYVSRNGKINPKQQKDERRLMSCFVDDFGTYKQGALIAPLLTQTVVGWKGMRSTYQPNWNAWHPTIAKRWGGRKNWAYDPNYLSKDLRYDGWLLGKSRNQPAQKEDKRSQHPK